MFGRKKQHQPPSQPFAHDPDCRIVKADPNVVIPWNEVETGATGGRSACARSSTTTSLSSMIGFDSIRSTRRPHVISGNANTLPRLIHRCCGSC